MLPAPSSPETLFFPLAAAVVDANTLLLAVDTAIDSLSFLCQFRDSTCFIQYEQIAPARTTSPHILRGRMMNIPGPERPLPSSPSDSHSGGGTGSAMNSSMGHSQRTERGHDQRLDILELVLQDFLGNPTHDRPKTPYTRLLRFLHRSASQKPGSQSQNIYAMQSMQNSTPNRRSQNTQLDYKNGSGSLLALLQQLVHADQPRHNRNSSRSSQTTPGGANIYLEQIASVISDWLQSDEVDDPPGEQTSSHGRSSRSRRPRSQVVHMDGNHININIGSSCTESRPCSRGDHGRGVVVQPQGADVEPIPPLVAAQAAAVQPPATPPPAAPPPATPPQAAPNYAAQDDLAQDDLAQDDAALRIIAVFNATGNKPHLFIHLRSSDSYEEVNVKL
ncbi:hypothetical protein P153DRAFT_390701 [Dothidotthia symphoricarpi CBS 119687]|uniref:Uncharacterized protein n=1 Tax=Dothidotthia symphoricarpi CBS 119687 TaxID=1392245 RepID=A0A6A5ZZ32_9PLEO|nr:uncharacterized protein P153DRAFT_390701 [Dothidotthia symphoricarpi CBS 119687]KAF2124154.1 hypothetical protein P153DRAFT_390701 [Dothidotthia symphoricarpi CBS 119687]